MPVPSRVLHCSQGLSEGNAPLKVLLLLTASADEKGSSKSICTPERGRHDAAAAHSRAFVSKTSVETLVRVKCVTICGRWLSAGGMRVSSSPGRQLAEHLNALLESRVVVQEAKDS